MDTKDHLGLCTQEYFIFQLWLNYSGERTEHSKTESLWDLLENFKMAMVENLKRKFPQYHIAAHLSFCINGQLHLLSSIVMASAMGENMLW